MRGHRVLICGRLFDTAEGGLLSPIKAGHRSVAYRFEPLGEEGERVAFGAIIEDVVAGGYPGEKCLCVLHFWADLAEVYATVGAEFDFWLGRVVGRGLVKEILSDP